MPDAPTAPPPARTRATPASAATDKKTDAKQQVGVTVVSRKEDLDDPTYQITKAVDDMASRQLIDPFGKSYGAIPDVLLRILEPEVNPGALSKLPTDNGTLSSCIDAMKTNIDSFGYSLEYVGPEGAQDSKEAKDEKQWIIDLMDRCNPDESITQVREKLRLDIETFGYGFLEIGRDGENNPAFIYHVPAQTMRVTAAEDDETEIKVWIKRGGKLEQLPTRKRFRRYVQLRPNSREKIFFKEVGDERSIEASTGLVKDGIDDDESATEMIWVNRYTPGFVYGLPRYIAQIAAILGSKEAEMVNLNFFRDNAIPALVVLISGGMLTEEAMSSMNDMFNGRRKGKEMVHRALVLEARSPAEDQPLDGSAAPPPKVDVKPLTQERQGDALFQKYDENNSVKIRMAFKLPALLVGLSNDYNRATAEASLDMAEALVFGPERAIIDNIVNDKILMRDGKPTQHWRYKSNPPRISNGEAKVKALESLNGAGGITPNISRQVLNELFGLRLPLIKEAWGDLPISFTENLIIQGAIVPETGLPENEVDGTVEDNPGSSGAAKEKPLEGKSEKMAKTTLKRQIRVRPVYSDKR